MFRPFVARIVLVVAGLGLAVPAAQAQFGISFGGNFQELTDIKTEPQATIDNAIGYHIGLFYNLGVGPLSLRPGVFYVDSGEFEAAVEEPCAIPEGCPAQKFDLQFVQVPIDVRFRTSSPVVRPYFLAGPVLRFAETSDEVLKESLNRFSYAGNIGLGVEVGGLIGIKAHTELRYAFGLSRIFDDANFLGATFEPDQEPQLNTWMLRFGVAL